MDKYLTTFIQARTQSTREKYELKMTRKIRWNQLKKERTQVMRFYKQINKSCIRQTFEELENIGVSAIDLYYIKKLAMEKNYENFQQLVNATGNIYHYERSYTMRDKRMKFQYYMGCDYYIISKPTEMLFRTLTGCVVYGGIDFGHKKAIYYKATDADIVEYMNLRARVYQNKFLFSQLVTQLVKNVIECNHSYLKKRTMDCYVEYGIDFFTLFMGMLY